MYSNFTTRAHLAIRPGFEPGWSSFGGSIAVHRPDHLVPRAGIRPAIPALRRRWSVAADGAILERLEGFEPPSFRFVAGCSFQSSYRRILVPRAGADTASSV